MDLRLLPVERRGVQHIVGLTPAVGRYAGGVWGMCQLGVVGKRVNLRGCLWGPEDVT